MEEGLFSGSATQLAQNLHVQNQERMRKIEDSIDKLRDTSEDSGKILTRIDENTKCVPDMKQRIESLEESRSKARGAFWMLGLIWAAIELLIHFFWKR